MTADIISQLWNENIVVKLREIATVLDTRVRRIGVEKLPRMNPLELPTVAELTDWFGKLEKVEQRITHEINNKMFSPDFIRERWRKEIEKNKEVTMKQIEQLQERQWGLAAQKERFLAERKDAIRELFTVKAEIGAATSNEARQQLRREVIAYRDRERQADAADNAVTRELIGNSDELQRATDILQQNRRSLEDECRREVDEFLEPSRMARELLSEVRTAKDVVWREVEEAQLTRLLAELDIEEGAAN